MFHAVRQSVSRSTIGRPAFSILVLGIALLAGQRMQAQSGYDAQIRGTVTDPSGAIVLGAKVTLTDVATAIATATETNEKGIYTLNGLRPGKYNLLVEQSGFQRAEAQNFELSVSQQAVINF